MRATSSEASASILLLADHLDAILAAGEDLVAVPEVAPAIQPARSAAGVQAALAARRSFVERVRTLEMSLVARVLKAREHALTLKRGDSRFRILAGLFLASTHVVADAAAGLGDPMALEFDSGRDAIAYLRSRGLIGEEAAGLPETATLAVSEEFRLAGVAPLGVLLDMAASFLDALDLEYELYGPADEPASAPDGGPAAAAA